MMRDDHGFPTGGPIPPADGDLVHARLACDCFQPPAASRSYATRATAGRGPAGEQVVDDITAAVDDLCACPCRQPIPPGGASAYFAGPHCQRRWHSARATNPDQVYGRVDAAVYPRRDDAVVPLTRPGAVLPDPDGEGDQVTDRQAGERRAVHDPVLSFMRRCDPCNMWVAPRTHNRLDVLIDGMVLPPDASRRPPWQTCPLCEAEFPGPALTASVHGEGRMVRLRLSDGVFWLSCLIDPEVLYAPGARRLINCTWEGMVTRLRSRSRGVDPTVAIDYLLRHHVVTPDSTIRVTGV